MWASQSRTIHGNVGELIADGFTEPLPVRIRALLEQGWGLGIGGGEIVAACSDHALTRAMLRAFLKQNLEYQYYLHGWQSAVDVIAHEALECYVERVKAGNTTDEEIEPLAFLIRNLSTQFLPPQAYQFVVNDLSLPSIVRLAGYFLGLRPFPDAAFRLVDETIRASKAEGQYSIPGWPLAIDALWCVNNPVDRWQAYIHDESLSEERRREILFMLVDSPLQEAKQVAILAQLQADEALSSDLKHTALLLRSYLGDSDAMNEVTSLLTNLSFEDLGLWAVITGKYRSGDIVLTGLRSLDDIPSSSDQRVRIARSLAFGLRMNVVISSSGGLSGFGRILHPAAPECACMIWEWADKYDGDAEGCLELLTAACELGYPGVSETLAQELKCFTDEYPDFFQDFGFDNTFSNALSALEDVGHSLPISTLQRCVEISESNAATIATSMIASRASEEALLILLQLHNTKADWHLRDNIARRIEELAGRLGVRIVRDVDRLVREG